MTHTEAHTILQRMSGALTCSFGYEGEGGYTAYYKTPYNGKFRLKNGSYLESSPFNWTLEKV